MLKIAYDIETNFTKCFRFAFNREVGKTRFELETLHLRAFNSSRSSRGGGPCVESTAFLHFSKSAKIGRKTSESFFASLYGSLFLGFFRHFDRCQIDLACDSHWPHDSCTCNITAMYTWAAGVCTV